MRSLRGWFGLILIAVFWPMNWLLSGDRTAYLFFPLWLGYILVVDALVERRRGSSIWKRSRRDFVLLFGLSIPAWWLFEVINRRLGNWEYLGADHFSRTEYNILSTISFSTVIPAVFGTAELARSFHWIERLKNGPKAPASRKAVIVYFFMGLAMFGSMIAWPRYCYPFAWTSLVFIFEPINRALRHPTLLQSLERGDWRPALSLATGSLICGFFWEMWNFYSYPKWVYHTPGTEFLHVFEMPLLGYLGYIPFSFELFAMKNLLWPRAEHPKVG